MLPENSKPNSTTQTRRGSASRECRVPRRARIVADPCRAAALAACGSGATRPPGNMQRMQAGDEVKEGDGWYRTTEPPMPLNCSQAMSCPSRKATPSSPPATKPDQASAPCPAARKPLPTASQGCRQAARRCSAIAAGVQGTASARSSNAHPHAPGRPDQQKKQHRQRPQETHHSPIFASGGLMVDRLHITAQVLRRKPGSLGAVAGKGSSRLSCGQLPVAAAVDGRGACRYVLRNEIFFGAGHAVIVRPAVDHRQLAAPIAMRRRRLRRLPFERCRAPRIAARRLGP